MNTTQWNEYRNVVETLGGKYLSHTHFAIPKTRGNEILKYYGYPTPKPGREVAIGVGDYIAWMRRPESPDEGNGWVIHSPHPKERGFSPAWKPSAKEATDFAKTFRKNPSTRITVRLDAVDRKGKPATWSTHFNGTLEEAKEYFQGHEFNVGILGGDRMVRVHKVTQVDGDPNPRSRRNPVRVWHHKGTILVDSPAAAGIRHKSGWNESKVKEMGSHPAVKSLLRRIQNDPEILRRMKEKPVSVSILDEDRDPWEFIGKSRRNPVVTSGAYVVPDNDITSRAASMG